MFIMCKLFILDAPSLLTPSKIKAFSIAAETV